MMPINNKIDFSKIMIDNKITHPETKKYKKSNFKKMLAKYDILFIKPTFGSKGYGIIIIEKVNKDFFSIKYKIQDRQKKWLCVNNKNIFKKELYAAVEEAKKQLKNTNSNYFIQQGIDIYKYKNQQTDFRVNVQRGLNGVIMVTSLVMRVGGNLSQGGRPADYKIVLQPLEEYSLSIENIKNEVINLSINAHLALEKFTGKEIGDLGMDLVIDNDGKAYIIEANTKNGYPSMYIEKNTFLENLYGLPPALSLCKQSDENHENNLIEYAKYLVKKTSISQI